MGLNFILLIVGLIVCFGGIYIRKACSALLGLIWGALCSFVVILMTVGLWGIDEEAFVIVAVCAVVCALISAIYDKLCAAINAFLSTFFIVALLLLMADSTEGTVLILIAAVIALIVSAISIKIYDYSFIIMTAFSGAFTASIGGCGIAYDADTSDVLMELLFGDEVTGFILVATLILGILGCIVQWRRLKGKPVKSAHAEYSVSDNGSVGEGYVAPVEKAPIQNPFVREIKEYWALLLAPWFVTIVWGLWGSQLLWRLFPSMYSYDFMPQTLWHYMPSIIAAILGGWEMATFIVAIKTRSKNFCVFWMVPNIIIALIYLVQMFKFIANYTGPSWLFNLAGAVTCFVPFLSWWVIRKLEKASSLFANSDVKAYALCGVCAYLVQRIIGKVIFFIETHMIAYSPSYTPPLASFLLLVLEIVVMAVVIKSMFKRNIPVDKVSTSVLHENKEGE